VELHAVHVVPRLRGRFGRPYLFIDECASTQRLFGEDSAEGGVVATDHQTEGRGRQGRRWEERPGTSLLFSIALRPPVASERLPELSLLAGEAVAEAIRATTGLEPALKFPNDVLICGRKVAGILAEAREGLVVLGVGVNVNASEDELPAGATSLSLETGREIYRDVLLVELLDRLERRYDRWVRSPASRP
jgi:BirA family transcriptional regulator, biotin operon repressor / biotin---[acetyl-CoA-carboxylase] ligase